MAFEMSTRAATPLQAARLEMGWKAAQVVHALQQAATSQGVTIATATSLKTMLSKWENGHSQPDPVSQRLLCRIYGQSPEELGLAPSGGPPMHLPHVAPV